MAPPNTLVNLARRRASPAARLFLIATSGLTGLWRVPSVPIGHKPGCQRTLTRHSLRGIAFGIGGAILGLIVYAAFGILSGFVIGYVSLAVGWIVGKAIKKGSNGIGGLRYQIAAVILTYAAVSLAAVPIGISQYLKSAKAHKAVVHSPPTATAEAGADPTVQGRPSPTSTPPHQTFSKGALAEKLLLGGLASPFLEINETPHAIIGLFILFIGLRIAWQLTGETPTQVLGPFKSSGAQASSLSSS